MGGRGSCCCACEPASLTNTISFDGTSYGPSEWISGSCCPNALWTFPAYNGTDGYLLYENIVMNTDSACNFTLVNPRYFCTRVYLSSVRFWLSKFTCDPSNWWVAMRAVAVVSMSALSTSTCANNPLGTVSFYREKFIPSIATPLTISFSSSDHYDWTAGGACHELSNCPDAYTGEIETSASWLCCDIFGTCVEVNPVTINFLANTFDFELT
jgi:hypothetical protein